MSSRGLMLSFLLVLGGCSLTNPRQVPQRVPPCPPAPEARTPEELLRDPIHQRVSYCNLAGGEDAGAASNAFSASE